MVCNLTTLFISGNFVCIENLATIGAFGVHLQMLIIDEYFQHTHSTLSCLVNGCPRD